METGNDHNDFLLDLYILFSHIYTEVLYFHITMLGSSLNGVSLLKLIIRLHSLFTRRIVLFALELCVYVCISIYLVSCSYV